MDFRLIQDAERQMLRDGKSAAAIDAMKSAYRKQMFNPDGYSQTAGLGSFASGGEAYGPPPVSGPVPQGIASFQDGGEADKVREFGNLEYEVEMNPFLEPISRAGFDPNVVKVMQNAGSHYNPNTDEIIIGNYTGTANLSEQAHEFRHRGLEKVASEFFLNIPTLKREMPPEDFKSLLNFFETMEEQRFRKRGVGGSFGRPGSEEYKFDRQEMIAEFFEEPYEYNLPAQYYAATGEDPASAKFQRVMNINPETKEPYTDEERAAYAARTGTVIKKILLQDTVQDQMDRLETVGQDEFRTFAGADPKTRTGDEIFKQAMLVQDFARKQNATAKKYSDGGAVMRGIGTLNETARNMTRGPRGIGAYQQFADGGTPQIRPKSRPPEMQEMAEIRSYLDSLPEAPSNLRPRARPEVEEKYFEINSYDINGETQDVIDFKDGMRLSMQDVENMIRGNRTATEPIIGRETGKEVLDFLQKNNPTSQEFIDYFSSARLSGGGEAYQQFADGGGVPRQTMINNQPHMLAYINPEEEQMLLENGGAGLPGPGGVPAYWSLFDPSTWKGGENYTPGAGFEGFTSESSNSAPAKTPTFNSLAAAAKAGYHGQAVNIAGKGLQKVEFKDSNYDKQMSNVSSTAPKESAGIMGLASKTYGKALDLFNPNSQKIAAMFPGPISMGLKGLAYLGGLRKTDPIVKVTDDKNVYQSGAGGFYIINSVTGLPMMVESPDDLSLSSDAKARMDAMMTGMNKSDNDNGPGSCEPGYVYDYSAGACVPMIGTTATSEGDALGTPQSIVVPDPVYLPVGLAEGGEVEEPLSEYQRALIASESSGRSNVVNDRGYRGLTQAGDAALADFKDQEGLNFSDEQYLNSPDLQMQFQRWYEQKTINYVMDKGLDAYIGKVIKGVPITMSSLLGMAHIGGDFGMQQFLETGGRYDPNDGKTSLSDYGRKFANMALYAESGGAGFNPVTPEETLMSMPVEQEGSLAFYRPRARPPEIEFSAPATSLRPIARPEEMMEPELEEIDASMQPRRQELREKYSLANMAEALTQQEPVGIMSATR